MRIDWESVLVIFLGIILASIVEHFIIEPRVAPPPPPPPTVETVSTGNPLLDYIHKHYPEAV